MSTHKDSDKKKTQDKQSKTTVALTNTFNVTISRLMFKCPGPTRTTVEQKYCTCRIHIVKVSKYVVCNLDWYV